MIIERLCGFEEASWQDDCDLLLGFKRMLYENLCASAGISCLRSYSELFMMGQYVGRLDIYLLNVHDVRQRGQRSLIVLVNGFGNK